MPVFLLPKARLLSLIVLCALLGSPVAAAQPAQLLQPRAKLAPWVLEHTANGAAADLLVVLSAQPDLSPAYALAGKAERGRYVRATLLREARASQAPLLAWLDGQGIAYRSYYIVNLVALRADRNLALALAARSDVARIEGDPRIRASLPSPAPDRSGSGTTAAATGVAGGIEPNVSYIRAPEVWAMGFTGQGIVVGGQDTGYSWDHPALKTHYRGWNGEAADHDYNWHDSIHTGANAVCPPNSPAPCDDYGHGTHTMGTVLGDDGQGNRIGTAPGAQWIGCRNMDNGVGSPSTYLECFEFFLAPYPVNGTPDQGDPALAPDVTNNSWGCPPGEGCSAAILEQAVEAQQAAGILTVVSAGNSGATQPCSTVTDPPALYAASYTVGALNTGADTIAPFSSRGPVSADGSGRRKPDITAPGTAIRSSWPGGGYESGLSGTSMAAPHVAGAVALLWSARPALRRQVAATERLLDTSASPILSPECGYGGWPNNVYGYGRLDVKAAVDRVPAGTGMWFPVYLPFQ